MIIVADSGATKTDWLKVESTGNIVSSFQSPGINPMVQTAEQIHDYLVNIPGLAHDDAGVKAVYFFGAGCSNSSRNKVVSDILAELLPHATIAIDHDLTGAVIALCGDSPGFACILGTGSNAVLFDGKQQIKKVPSLGWALGDEGSGAYFGKRLLRDYCYHIVPAAIAEILEHQFMLNKEGILEAVYKKPNPNRYLAGFMPVLGQCRENEYVQKILAEGFDDFIRYQITCYDNFSNYPANFVGSVALIFREELTAACSRAGISTNKFVQKPVEDIAAYLIKKHISE